MTVSQSNSHLTNNIESLRSKFKDKYIEKILFYNLIIIYFSINCLSLYSSFKDNNLQDK